MTGANSTTLQVALTDADGDFIRYAVNVVSLDLTKEDGTVVHTLPAGGGTLVDFAQYVDLTEFLTAATVPTGNYKQASITLDYSQADIEVELNGQAVQATPVDSQGNPLNGQYTLQIQFSNSDTLILRPGVPRLLTLDFNLAASNAVDTTVTPPVVTVSPVLVTDVDHAPTRQLRVRGALVSVDTANSSYVVDVRPCWRDDDASFGQVTVHVNTTTAYEIDGTTYTGSAGLDALAAETAGTITEAHGTLDIPSHSFTAASVAAGTSVGSGTAAVAQGVVVARAGNLLTVRGVTFTRNNNGHGNGNGDGHGSVVFSDNAAITVGANTKVTKQGDEANPTPPDIGAISVGQKIRVTGDVTDPGRQHLAIDASGTDGRVKLMVTRMDGVLAAGSALTNPGPLAVQLQAIEGRALQNRHGNAVFDFIGTGQAGQDADPAAYGVATGALPYSLQSGNPVRFFGFVAPFGGATPAHDFDAQTLVDLETGHARLSVDWGDAGTTAPFLTPLATSGLTLDAVNVGLSSRHVIVVGGVTLDLTMLVTQPTIGPVANGPVWFAIRQGHALQVYSDFPGFVAALGTALDGVTVARSLYAEGNYNGSTGSFTAQMIVISLSTGT